MEVKFDFPILQKHGDNMDEASAKFLDRYKGSFASEINYDLRYMPFDEINRESQVYIHYLDTIIREQPRSDKELYLYRGVQENKLALLYFGTDRKLSNISALFKHMVGECILFREFLSTTFNPRIACEFATGNHDEPVNIVLKFKIPPGYPILALDEAVNVLNEFDREQAMEEGEDEILLPRNGVFRVTSIKKIKCPRVLRTKDPQIVLDVYLITLDTSCPQIKPAPMPELTKKDMRYLANLMK
jgi:hypothetical protein